MFRTHRPSRMSILTILTAAAFFLLPMLSTSAASANSSGETITSFETSYLITEEGDVQVEEVITYNFGSEQKRGIIRSMPAIETVEGKTRARTYEGFTALLNGQATGVREEKDGNVLNFYVGDQTKIVSGSQQYTLRYTVNQPLLDDASGGVSFTWHPTGGGWGAQIHNVKATVSWENDAPVPATVACASNSPCPITIDQENRTISYESATPLVATAIFPAESFPVAPFPEPEQVEAGERAIPGWMQDRLDHPNNPEMWRDNASTGLDAAMLGSIVKFTGIVIGVVLLIWIVVSIILPVLRKRKEEQSPDSYSVTNPPSNASSATASSTVETKPTPKPQVDPTKIKKSDLEAMVASLVEQGVVKVDEASGMVERTGWGKTGRLTSEERTLLERSFNGRSSMPVKEFRRNAVSTMDSLVGKTSENIVRQRSIYNSYEKSGKSSTGGYYNNPMTYLLLGMMFAQSSDSSSGYSSSLSSSSSNDSYSDPFSSSLYGSSFGSSLSSDSSFSFDSFGGGGSSGAGGGSW